MNRPVNEDEIQHLADLVGRRLERPTGSRKVWDWIFKASIPFSVVLFSFTIGWASAIEARTTEIETRLDIIDATRFTASDGAEMQRLMTSEIAKVNVQVTAVASSISALSNQLSRIESRLDER